jgi:hypothetical protein
MGKPTWQPAAPSQAVDQETLHALGIAAAFDQKCEHLSGSTEYMANTTLDQLSADERRQVTRYGFEWGSKFEKMSQSEQAKWCAMTRSMLPK